MEIDKELVLAQNSERSRKSRDFRATAISFRLVVLLSFRVRSRASLEELIALRHQVTIIGGETFLAAVG